MCGIFAYTGSKKTAATTVLTALKTLEYRGYDSWGVGVAASQKAIIKKQPGKIGEAHVNNLPDSSCGFGHTRWATHGA